MMQIGKPHKGGTWATYTLRIAVKVESVGDQQQATQQLPCHSQGDHTGQEGPSKEVTGKEGTGKEGTGIQEYQKVQSKKEYKKVQAQKAQPNKIYARSAKGWFSMGSDDHCPLMITAHWGSSFSTDLPIGPADAITPWLAPHNDSIQCPKGHLKQ
jgi:hypothetical protein